MEFKNIVVVGGGVLGSQIAFQIAYKGFSVTMWLRSDASIQRAKPKVEQLYQDYLSDLRRMATPAGKAPHLFCRGLADATTFRDEDLPLYEKKVENAYETLSFETDLAKAVADADLIIESIAEDPQAKIDFYTTLAPLLPEKTVIATNSSTLLPSMFASYTGRPEKYLAMHFANHIWSNNTAEIMGHAGTDPAVFDALVQFAKDIGMVPLPLHKEQPGYILNSLLIPLLQAGQALYANEVADPQTIDLTWKLGTGAPKGPFEILDIVGLTTAYNICKMSPGADDPNTTAGKIVAMLKKYIDEGKTGIAAGEGFYQYKK